MRPASAASSGRTARQARTFPRRFPRRSGQVGSRSQESHGKRSKEQRDARNLPLKTCTRCRMSKARQSFGDAHRNGKVYCQSWCKDCECEYRSQPHLRAAAVTRATAWQKANPERVKAHARIGRQRYPERKAAHCAKRHAAQMKRTPPWLTQTQVAEMKAQYAFARAMEQITGQKHHVDHIVPLKGKTVSGLHVPWNLRVIRATENLRKSNRVLEPGQLDALIQCPSQL